jgi:hypothetical protein
LKINSRKPKVDSDGNCGIQQTVVAIQTLDGSENKTKKNCNMTIGLQKHGEWGEGSEESKSPGKRRKK